jgi:short-subunit dehydrogenase
MSQFFASLTFCIANKNALTFHSDGPMPFCIKQLTTSIPKLPTNADLSGKTVLITGANSGMGFESSKTYAKHGARLIFGVRDVKKGEIAAQKIRDEFESAHISVIKIDMENFETIKEFVEEVEQNESRVDIAVLNAGVCHYRTFQSPTGYDVHLQVCCFSPAGCRIS